MTIDAVDQFLAEVRALLAGGTEPGAAWEAAKAPMARMLADPAVAEAAKSWPVTDRENLLFYEDPDYGFVLNGLIKAPGHKTRIHDHGRIFTLYGVLTGEEEIAHYVRTDEPRDDAHPRLEETDRTPVRTGTIDLVGPRAIHAEYAGAAGSVAMILRTEKPGPDNLQGRYYPEAGRWDYGPGIAQVPYSLAG